MVDITCCSLEWGSNPPPGTFSDTRGDIGCMRQLGVRSMFWNQLISVPVAGRGNATSDLLQGALRCAPGLNGVGQAVGWYSRHVQMAAVDRSSASQPAAAATPHSCICCDACVLIEASN